MNERNSGGILKVLFASVGLAEKLRVRFENLMDELEERGRLRSSDSRDYMEKILERARGEKEESDEVLREIFRDIAESAGLATAGDVKDMALNLDVLEKRIRSLYGWDRELAVEETLKAFGASSARKGK